MRKLKLFFACLLMAVLSIGQMWADTKTEGFETKAASTTYNSTVTVSSDESDCGIGWTIFYGTVSTNDKISGSKSAQMRYYSSSDNRGYVQSTTPIDGLSHVAFKARVSSTNIKMTVSYSTDASTWTALATNVTFTETGKGIAFDYDVPTGGKYIKFEVGNGSTKPSSGNIKFIIDDVVFTYEAGGSSVAVTGVTLNKSELELEVDENETLTATVAPSNASDKSVSWSSDDESVATVANGVVTAVAEGTATITVTTTDGSYTATCDVTVTAAAPVASNWQVTAPSDLATGDVVVLTMLKNSVYYAAPNNGTGAPAATVVAVANSKLSNSPAETLQWTVTVVSEGVYQFSKGTNYLKCTDTNNGVRVGTGDYNTFDVVVENEKSYLHTTEGMTNAENGRYLGIYNTQDWRCYSSVNNNIKDGSLVIFREPASSKEAAGLAFETAAYLVKANGSLATPTLTNPNNLTVTYTSSDANVVAVNETTGALTIKAAGKAEITASSEETETYKAGSASYTVYVAAQAGTADDPLSEASAKALIDLGCTMNAHVAGTIFGTPSYNETYHNYSVTLTDGFQFYRLKDLNNADFTSGYLKAGDELIAVGPLSKHNTTYELGEGCYLTSYAEYVAPLVDISNTKETAYTVAQALTLAANPTSDLDNSHVFISGVVYDVKNFDSENGTLDIYIKDDGVDNKFEFYKCKGINDGSATTPFASSEDVQVGNVVIGYGMLKYYSGGSIWEFDNTKDGDYIVDLQVPVTGIELDATAEVEVGDDVDLIAAILPSNATGTIVWSVESGDTYASVDENGVVTGVTEGEAVIRATVQGTAFYAECTVTVTAAAAPDTRHIANSPATFTTVSGDMTPNDITFAANQGGAGTAPGIYNSGIRLYQAPSASTIGGYITLTAKAGCTIDEVQITTTSTYATTVVYSVDGNETLLKSENVAKSGSYTTGTGLNVSSVNIVNKGTSSSGRLEIASIKVYYTGEPASIHHYVLGGTYQTAFMQGDEFNHTGLIVYAAYDELEETKVDITSMCTFSEPDMSTTGEKTIEITYNEAVVTSYTINVAADSRKVANSPATFTAVSGDMTPADITFASYQGGAGTAPATYNDGIRLYQAPSESAIGGFITLKAKKGCTIDQVKITTTNTYATTVAYSVDGNENLLGSESVAKSGEYTTPSGLNKESVNIVNKGTGSNGRLEIASIKVWYTGDALPVHHYILGGTYATEFEQYGEFNFEGLTVTAAYDELETITEAVTGFTVEADLNTAGAAKANVMLNSVKIAEYDITVTASAKTDPALAYNPASVILTLGQSLTAPAFSNDYNVSPITYNSDKKAVATVDAEGNIALAGGVGTAVITASFAGNEDYLASEATFTITVNAPAEDLSGTWVVATSIAAGDRIIIADVAAAGVVYTMGEQANNGTGNNRVAVESAVDEYGVLTPAAGTKTFLVVDVENGEFALQALNGNYLYAASNSSNHLKETSDINNVNAKWTITIENGVATIKALHEGHTSRNWMRKNESSAIFSCYGSGQEDIVIYKIGTPDYGSYQRTVTNGNYGTICLPKAGTISGATLFEIADYDGNMIYVDEILSGEMEAGVPYIFQATSEQLNVVYTSGTIVDEAGSANGLYGFYNLENEDAQFNIAQDAGNYILYQNAYWLVSGRAAYIANYRAYIKLNQINNTGAQAPGRRRVAMAVNGEQTATGIGELNASETPVKMIINGQMYILRGEKMYDVTGKLVK